MANRNQKSTKALSEEEFKELDKKAWNDLVEAETIDESLDALGRGVWLKNHGTKPPEIARPTPADIRAFIEHNESLDRSAMCEASRELSTWLIRKGLPYHKSDNDHEGHEVRVPRGLVYSEALICYLLGLAVVNDDGNFVEVRGTQDLKPFSIMAMFSLEKNLSVLDLLQRLIKASLIYKNDGYEGELPPEPIVEAWQNRPRSIEVASVDHVSNLTPIPYVVSEVNRHQWEKIGSIDAVFVDGEPLASKMPSFASGDKPITLKPKGAQGQIELSFSQPRNPGDKPIVLIAFEYFGGDLRKSIAVDTAFFLFLIFASNHSLELTDQTGAQLLARNKDGNFRRVTQTDRKRFESVYFAMRSLGAWFYDPDIKISKYFEFVKADRESRNVVNLRKPAWYQRESGLWTLSAGFGGAGIKRLSLRANDGGIWRYIGGIEFWLARDSWVKKGPNKRIANALLPAQGKTGSGQWVTLDWQDALRLCGDRWDAQDTREHNKAKQRMKRLREYLEEAGYVTDLGKSEAEAGDTIEFNFDKRGKVLVRATARFVEGAKKAQKQDWETIGLMDYLTP